MKVLVIRAGDPAARTARNLSAHGHEAVLLPLSEIRPTGASLPEGRFDALIFTSAAAPRILALQLADFPVLLHLSAYCVGEATAVAAREAGFEECRVSEGDARSLAEMISSDIDRKDLPERAEILYPAARHRAFDFAAALPQARIETVTVYESALRDPGRDEFMRAVQALQKGAVFIHSARACRHFFDLSARYDAEGALADLTVVTISETVAGEAPEWAANRIIVAETPDEAAMIRSLGD